MLSNRSGFRMLHVTLLFAIVALALAAVAPAAAEEAQYYQGEPTDPEKTLVTATENADELEKAGMDLTAPADADEYDAWYQALVDLLEALGLLPAETTP